MDTLHPNWVTEGTLDFEYKKYLLLAYLQHCKAHFDQTRLFPPLSELVNHYRNLAELKNGLNALNEKFPRELKALDAPKLEMKYETTVPEAEYISTITEIADFALPSLLDSIHEGQDIYELVERNTEIIPIGIEPIYRDEGFLLINDEPDPEIYIYSFRHSIIPHPGENTRALGLTYLYSERKSLSNTVEQIKLDLIQRFRDLPNPATFFCVSHLHVPMSETLLPVSKRLLMKRLAS